MPTKIRTKNYATDFLKEPLPPLNYNENGN
jgi:hypothetical protein